MKTWTWQKWLGKIVLLATGIGELVIEALEITSVGYWPAIVTFAAWLVQFIVGMFPPKEPA